MAKRRNSEPSKLVDFIVEAISPALIIGMICCLVFFLIVAFYRSEFDLRLMYIQGLFTLGIVLIARIAIESGRAYANWFAIPMAIVSVLAMFRFVELPGELAALSWLMNLGLLALIWYLADRITYDCTLEDPKRKISHEGLLQSLGMVRPAEWGAVEPASSVEPSRLQDNAAEVCEFDAKRKKTKHNPGMWVLRFALLALPLFGFGQLVIEDSGTRSIAFWFLFGYLVCALGLLVCTSVLSVRRYLHERGATMPTEIVVRWLGSSAIGILAILALCILLPLPGRTLGLIELPFELKSPEGLSSSRFGWGREGTSDEQNADSSKTQSDKGEPSGNAESDVQKEGKGGEKMDGGGKEGDEKQSGGKASDGKQNNRNDNAGKQSGEKESGKQPPGAEKSDANDSGKNKQGKKERSGNENEKTVAGKKESDVKENGDNELGERERSEQKRSGKGSEGRDRRIGKSQGPARIGDFLRSITTDFASLFKWLTIAALVLFVLFYAITHPREIARLLRDIADFFAALFGSKRAGVVQNSGATPQMSLALTPPRTPFSAFVNPFLSGEKLNGVQVVERTFAALEAWAADAGVARHQDETAREFAGRLVSASPRLGKPPVQAAGMLDQVMFAGWLPSSSDLQPLEKLWRTMSTSS